MASQRSNDNSDLMSEESDSTCSEYDSDSSKSSFDGSNTSSSSSEDSPIVLHRKPKKINILISDDEDLSDHKSSLLANKSTSRSDSSSNKSNNLDISDPKSSSNANISTTRSDSSANTSKNLSSFVDSNLFANDSRQNISKQETERSNTNYSSRKSSSKIASTSTASEKLNSSVVKKDRKSKRSSRQSFTKSFAEYRDNSELISSDEEENKTESSRSHHNGKEKFRNSRSSIHQKTRKSKSVVNESSEDEQFEVEFQRNVYSPRTRMSITGVGCSISDSESDSDYPKPPVKIEMNEPIEIPDSDDDNSCGVVEGNDNSLSNFKKFNTSDINPLQTSSPLPKAKPMLQPKVTNFTKVKVSQEYFDEQVIKLNIMENELHKSIQLRGAFQVKLPDDGRRLSGRIDRLKLDIEQLEKHIQSITVESIPAPLEASSEQNTKKNEISWDALDAATNQVQPQYTGKIGLSNFNTQKVITLETLKEIHESISSCPTPDTLADDPDGLKIELMPHQRHALSWLEWRENQRPRGGILADDMGLGKTLTIIAHVLAAKYRNEDNSNDESDEKENPHNGWTAKGRKDYYSGGTLVICPASLIGQWESELAHRVKRNLLTHIVHHGAKRDVKARHLAKADIVITTYNIVSRECHGNNNGPLANIKWDRVVLDEAHVIRNHKTRISESVSSLIRRHSWLLTGTPIQNKEMDIYAALRFLKCRPFDDLGHFKKWIDNKNAGGQLRMNTILKALLLRRTKAELISSGNLLQMTTKTMRCIEVTMEKEEMKVYQKIMLYSRTLFAQYLHQRAEKGDERYDNRKAASNSKYHKAHQMLVQLHAGDRDVKTHEILVLLLRLRQICCHPGLITTMLEDEDKSNVLDESVAEENSLDVDLMEQLEKLNVNDNDSGSGSFGIPTSNPNVPKASEKVLVKSNPVFDLSRPSSKFNKVLEVLNKHVLPLNEHAVIVSQWTHVLEVLGKMLHRAGISYSSLTGTVPVKSRGAIVENFNRPSQITKVLLLSLTAGGVGLNLVGGNHLILVDLHWNPQLEAQAQDRVYRVGQTKPVTIYKLVCNDTIEQRIQKLQEQKLAIANGVLTGSSTKGSKLTIDDLKSLFDV